MNDELLRTSTPVFEIPCSMFIINFLLKDILSELNRLSSNKILVTDRDHFITGI